MSPILNDEDGAFWWLRFVGAANTGLNTLERDGMRTARFRGFQIKLM